VKRRQRRETDVFSMSFLDVISCGFGAIILLLVLNEVGEPLMASPAVSDGTILWRTPRRLIAVAER
jgi:hypothetical protein